MIVVGRPHLPTAAPYRRAAEPHVGATIECAYDRLMAEPTKPLLQAVLPDFTGELSAGLLAIGRRDLADQVPALRIWDRCRCGDSVCTSFYVGPKPAGPWRGEGDHENTVPEVDHGMIVLDVVAGTVRYVEVLDRPEIGAALRAATRTHSSSAGR